MQVIDTEIPAIKLLEPKRFGDDRGFFSETFNRKCFAALLGAEVDFVQDNHALSAHAGVVRGLHYQIPPMAQSKLLRVTRGAILDIAVDIRRASPTFGKHVRAVLSAQNWRQIWVPEGFAHGYVTLEPNTEVIYKVTNYYSPEHERGIRWDDPALGIEWGIESERAVLSHRDTTHPTIQDAADLFQFVPADV